MPIDLITLRRKLHQIPELALNETQTHAFLMTQIQQLPQTYLDVIPLPALPTAILVAVTGSHPKRTIGYRADMDALPVTEDTGLPFASTHPGISHACGHDIHMTVAFGLLAHFATHQPTDHLLFFFQPAEESESGAKVAYDSGAFSGPWAVDEFYGLHDRPDLPAGTIATRNGTLFAGTTEINVDFTGKSGHAALPQNANDMVIAAATFILQAQTIISRNISPTDSGVITFGKVEAGTIRNVIAGSAHLEGTLRGFTQDTIRFLQSRLRALAEGIATSFQCDVHLDLNQGGYFPVENDPQLTANFIQYMQTTPGVDFQLTDPVMTGEDFGYLLHHIPGTMFWLGVHASAQLHAANFSPNEAAIQPAIDAMIGFLTMRMSQPVEG